MGKTKIKKKYSKTDCLILGIGFLILGLFVLSIAIPIVYVVLLIHSVNEKKSEYDEYLKMTNSVSAEKNLDDKSKDVYESIREKNSMLKDLKTSLSERTTRREELKSQATDKNNNAAEAEAKMAQYMKELGFSSYEELLAAYNDLLKENR